MMNRNQTISAVLALSAMLVALTGCQKQADPAKQAGISTDQATEQIAYKIDLASHDIRGAAESYQD